MRYRLTLFSLLILSPAAARAADAARAARAAGPAVPVADGDRIVLLGGTLIEREQRYGFWETALLLANPDKRLTVRNLGWSGDTVWGEARAGFGNQAHGFKQLVDLVLASKPTLIVLAYGGNEAFEGDTGLPKFVAGYETLLAALAPAKARLAFMLPLHQEKLGRRLPDPAGVNGSIDRYAAAIRDLAARHHAPVIDLEARLKRDAHRLTDDGSHLTEDGYRATAPAFVAALGYAPATTPVPDALRRLVVEKNELYFHRWRPQNETYLFGFRKHEQGKNAAEVAAFDPLVAAKEDEIVKLLRTIPKP